MTAVKGFNLTAEEVKERFLGYLDAFSRQSHADLARYVAKDLHFVRGDGIEPFRGREELFAFHGPELCWKYFDERFSLLDMEIVHLPAPGTELELCYFTAHIRIQAKAFADWTDPPFGYVPMRAGDEFLMNDRVLYAMNSAGQLVSILWMTTEMVEG